MRRDCAWHSAIASASAWLVTGRELPARIGTPARRSSYVMAIVPPPDRPLLQLVAEGLRAQLGPLQVLLRDPEGGLRHLGATRTPDGGILIEGQDLTRERTYELFRQVLLGEQPDLQQGALLAALVGGGVLLRVVSPRGDARDEPRGLTAAMLDTLMIVPDFCFFITFAARAAP